MEIAPTPPHDEKEMKLSGKKIILLSGLGAIVGLLSGVFGIGGGTLIVPALVFMGLSQRSAAATSLAAIIPTSISGVISYSMSGHVDWVAAILMIVGVIAGSQVGSWLLSKLPESFLRWAFVVFMIAMAIGQFVVIPQRGQSIQYSVLVYVSLVLFGFVMGIISGLLGIGGGVIAVSTLMFFFGASDLSARGTSLLTIFPGSLFGTIANFRRGVVHLKTGLIIGVSAAIFAPFGALFAAFVSPRVGSLLFGTYLVLMVIRSIYATLKMRKEPTK